MHCSRPVAVAGLDGKGGVLRAGNDRQHHRGPERLPHRLPGAQYAVGDHARSPRRLGGAPAQARLGSPQPREVQPHRGAPAAGPRCSRPRALEPAGPAAAEPPRVGRGRGPGERAAGRQRDGRGADARRQRDQRHRHEQPERERSPATRSPPPASPWRAVPAVPVADDARPAADHGRGDRCAGRRPRAPSSGRPSRLHAPALAQALHHPLRRSPTGVFGRAHEAGAEDAAPAAIEAGRRAWARPRRNAPVLTARPPLPRLPWPGGFPTARCGRSRSRSRSATA